MTDITEVTADFAGLRLTAAGVSEQGPRSENQDAFSVDAFAETGVVAVADGMGGERGGRIAADTALRAVLSCGPVTSLDGARHAVRAADQAVAHAAQENPTERAGMGCALAVLSVARGRDSGGWIAAYAGDVRILSRGPDGTVRLESRDHTPAYARWEAGEIGLDEITEAEGANRLQRAIGRGGEADVAWIPIRPGWAYLIASDGVSKATRLEELGEAMAAPSPAAGCDIIRRKVAERGPEDNYTAVLVHVGGGPGGGAHPTPSATPMSARRRSAGATLATLLALIALALAGWAVWSGMQARSAAATNAEVQGLRRSIDSLRARLPVDTVTALGLEPIDTSAPVPPLTPAPR